MKKTDNIAVGILAQKFLLSLLTGGVGIFVIWFSIYQYKEVSNTQTFLMAGVYPFVLWVLGKTTILKKDLAVKLNGHLWKYIIFIPLFVFIGLDLDRSNTLYQAIFNLTMFCCAIAYGGLFLNYYYFYHLEGKGDDL